MFVRARSMISASAAAIAEGCRTAALHGRRLLDDGYTVDQVVHGYGDVCQAITELAAELQMPIAIDEFHTLNRLLDNAIADSVSSYGKHRDSVSGKGEHDLHERTGTLADEHRIILDRALKALEAGGTGE